MDIIAIVVTWLALCGVAAWIASNKGRNGAGAFFLSLFLSPLVGLIVAVAMAPNPAGQGKKKCPKCAEYVQPDAKICRFCQHDFATEEEAARLAREEELKQQAADLERRKQEEKERQEAYEAEQAALPWHKRAENREAMIWVPIVLVFVGALAAYMLLSKDDQINNNMNSATSSPVKAEATVDDKPKTEWHVTEPRINPMNNVSTQFVANGEAVRIVLCFSDRKPCAHDSVPVYVRSPCWIDGNEPGSHFRTIQVKFDDQKPTKEVWGITDDNKGLVPPRPRAFVGQLNKHKTMMVQFGCDRSDPGEVVTLDINGLQETLDSANLKFN